jgi:hypothetical protein
MGLGIASAAAGALAVRQAVTQSLRPRPYLVHLADEAPVRVVEKEYATFGMPFKKEYAKSGKTGGAAAQAESPTKWTFIEDYADHNYLDQGKRGENQLKKFGEFKTEITKHNTHPREAAKVYESGLYENFPNYKNFKPTDKHKGFMHAHIRVTYEHRAFFLVNDDTRTIIIKQVGAHDPYW